VNEARRWPRVDSGDGKQLKEDDERFFFDCDPDRYHYRRIRCSPAHRRIEHCGPMIGQTGGVPPPLD
jgi:hypothetical protein